MSAATIELLAPDSFPAPLLAKLGPIIQPLLDLALEAPFRRIVELLTRQIFREIILTGEGLVLVVVIGVTAAIAFVLHQRRRRVENVLGRQQRAGLLGGAHGG